MFDLFKNTMDGMVAREKLVRHIEKKHGYGPITMRDKMITAYHIVCKRHGLLDEFCEEFTRQYMPKDS